MAIACDPGVIIADEPTSALDVTLQASILWLLNELTERGISIVLISHNIGVLAALADDMLVISSGHVVEAGSTRDLLHNPRHAHTQELIASLPASDILGAVTQEQEAN
jgi:ABC-type dipeptide/oligopeptide/nickel transport system ATPase component